MISVFRHTQPVSDPQAVLADFRAALDTACERAEDAGANLLPYVKRALFDDMTRALNYCESVLRVRHAQPRRSYQNL